MATKEQNLHYISSRMAEAMRQYGLINDGDRVLVALSGGKDSLCLMEFLARRARIFMPRFSVEAVHIRMENVDYQSDTAWMEAFCNDMGVKLHVLSASFEPDRNLRRTPCFLCSWTRRKFLFRFALENGFNKIALGHHMDDLLHTLLMNELFAGRFDTMPLRLRLTKMPLTIIRPLGSTRERAIAEYAVQSGYRPQQKRCPYEHEGKRHHVRALFELFEKENPDVRASLWHALEKEGKLIEN